MPMSISNQPTRIARPHEAAAIAFQPTIANENRVIDTFARDAANQPRTNLGLALPAPGTVSPSTTTKAIPAAELTSMVKAAFGTDEPEVISAVIKAFGSRSAEELEGLLDGGSNFLSTLLSIAAPVLQGKAREEITNRFPDGKLVEWTGKQEFYNSASFLFFTSVQSAHSAARVKTTGPLSIKKSGENAIDVSLPIHAWGRGDFRVDSARVPAEASCSVTPHINMAFSAGEGMRPRTTTNISLDWNSPLTLRALGLSIGVTNIVNAKLRPHIEGLASDIDNKHIPALVDQTETFIKNLIQRKLGL